MEIDLEQARRIQAACVGWRNAQAQLNREIEQRPYDWARNQADAKALYSAAIAALSA